MASLIGDILGGGVVLLVLAAWAYGMYCYFKIAKAAGCGFIRAWWTLDVYRYAFVEMKGSRETRGMTVGFGLIVVLVIAGNLVRVLR